MAAFLAELPHSPPPGVKTLKGEKPMCFWGLSVSRLRFIGFVVWVWITFASLQWAHFCSSQLSLNRPARAHLWLCAVLYLHSSPIHWQLGKLREGRSITCLQGHLNNKWQSQNSTPGSPSPECTHWFISLHTSLCKTNKSRPPRMRPLSRLGFRENLCRNHFL